MKPKKFLDINILVTRPYPSGAELCEQIELHGAHAIHLPTIAFTSPKNINQLKTTLHQLKNQHYIIFISPQAVQAALPLISKKWPAFPARVKLAGIGKGTAHALHQAGYRSVIYPKKKWDSKGLLALPAFRSVKGKKIAIIRGDPGREVLEQTLTHRGARILSLVIYRRLIPEIEMKSYRMLLKQHTIDVIVATSGEGVINLTKMIGKASHNLLIQVPLIVVSKRIKVLAQNLGFQTIWIAQDASHHMILKILTKKRKELCLMKMNRSLKKSASPLNGEQ